MPPVNSVFGSDEIRTYGAIGRHSPSSKGCWFSNWREPRERALSEVRAANRDAFELHAAALEEVAEAQLAAAGGTCDAVIEPAHAGRYAVGGSLDSESTGGSIRRTVWTRSMDLSNDAMAWMPVLSACATRYASAKSMRSSS